MFLESKTDQVTLESISIILILGWEEACWLLWVCHWPRVFWEHSEKPPLLIFHLNFHSKYFALKVENMFHVSFLVKQRVVCLTVRCTWCNYHTILVNILHIFQQISPSGWWWSGSAFPGASVRWVRWKRSNWLRFDVNRAVWLGRQGGGGRAIWTTKHFDWIYYHFWLGGRGGGEEEVVKNQAVISISYQVWENMSGCFGITEKNLFLGLAGDEGCSGD